jgi:hypothetical protein
MAPARGRARRADPFRHGKGCIPWPGYEMQDRMSAFSTGLETPMPSARRPPSDRAAAPRYRHLLERLDAWSAQVRPLHEDRMACRPGCDDCCRRHLSVFPVEAEALARAVRDLPGREYAAIEAHIARWDQAFGARPGEAPCPLLQEARCLLYHARPVLCRTHGFPLLTRPSGDPDSGEPGFLTWCEKNFRDAPDIPVSPGGVLDLDRINRVLGAVQALRDTGRSGTGGGRILLRTALGIPARRPAPSGAGSRATGPISSPGSGRGPRRETR